VSFFVSFFDRLKRFFDSFREPKLYLLDVPKNGEIRWGEAKIRFPDTLDQRCYFETIYDIIWDDDTTETVPTHHFQWEYGTWTRRNK
jgi:hypothetical protein